MRANVASALLLALSSRAVAQRTIEVAPDRGPTIAELLEQVQAAAVERSK